ncbi:unnamed protein product [Trifolium pratense]|uniref:Uncharacterized protein n=2 Tax=Trifolium pratense TaxID=57577 RepID=A0ACB0IY58_TRIPR|nr:unnamed protein product [Trifolium pratense]CAJ2657938.1 unnamed protein product [Trifolium pratense]
MFSMEELAKRFNLFKLWTFSSFKFKSFTETYADSLSNPEVDSTYSVGLDKIYVRKGREKGIRVANMPDVLTDEVAVPLKLKIV